MLSVNHEGFRAGGKGGGKEGTWSGSARWEGPQPKPPSKENNWGGRERACHSRRLICTGLRVGRGGEQLGRVGSGVVRVAGSEGQELQVHLPQHLRQNHPLRLGVAPAERPDRRVDRRRQVGLGCRRTAAGRPVWDSGSAGCETRWAGGRVEARRGSGPGSSSSGSSAAAPLQRRPSSTPHLSNQAAWAAPCSRAPRAAAAQCRC